MADNDFGTPDAHDATSIDERAVIEAAKADVSLDKAAKDSVRNRPLGSVPISPQDERSEWDLNLQAAEAGDPSLLATFFTDQKMTVEQKTQYAKKMLK